MRRLAKYASVVTWMEVGIGIRLLRLQRRYAAQAQALHSWFTPVCALFFERTLPVDESVVLRSLMR